MANIKRLPGSTPPSARPERQEAPELVARELPDWPVKIVGATHIRSLQKLLGELRE